MFAFSQQALKLQTLLHPIIPLFLHNFNHTFIPPHCKSINPNNKVQNLLSNCTNLHQINQIYGHIIRTHYLEFNNAPFYYNIIIRLYTRLGSPIYAFNVYICMLRLGVLPDNYTLPITIKALGQICDLKVVEQVHKVAICLGLVNDEFVESGLINVYVKRGDFGNAYKVFDESPERKVGCWNAIISGLCQRGCLRDGLSVFLRMRRCGVVPDGVTMVSVNSACGGLGDLKLAMQLHKCVFQVKWKGNEGVLLMNSVIDMYGKCGKMELACRVFDEMSDRNVSSWTSMIVGYASHGYAKEAMEVFYGMIEAGVRPNYVTFVGVLSACVHAGLVDEGKRCFRMMENVYGIKPCLKHYGCMADLFGRAGFLEEARRMVEEMSMKPNEVIWGCLLAASEKYNDVRMGEWVARHFLELQPWNDGVYVVLSNIYANREMWKDVEKIRQIMKQRRLAKLQGYSAM